MMSAEGWLAQRGYSDSRPHSFVEIAALLEEYARSVRTAEEFKDRFVVTFLATWCAQNHADYCARGWHAQLADPPVEDAQHLAGEAWTRLQAL